MYPAIYVCVLIKGLVFERITFDFADLGPSH